MRCESQLRQVAIGCIMYANDHRGQFPPTLDTILSTDGFTPDLLLCPSAAAMAAQRRAPAAAMATSPGPGAHSSYIYCGKGVTTRERDWDVIIAVEPLDNHGSEGVNIAFADARTEWLDATRARKVLDQVYNGTRPVRLTSK